MDKIVNLSVSIDLGEYGKKTFLSYEEMVDYLAQNRIDYTFSNSNVNHSMMLINKFSEIDGKFCLYVKSFKKVIFNNSKLISNIKNFLERDKNNEIKVTEAKIGSSLLQVAHKEEIDLEGYIIF